MNKIEEHPIQYLRTELMDFAERMRWVGTDVDKVQRAIDLSCENIIEHFDLEESSEETALKEGFYAGQANAGVSLENCHENYKAWADDQQF